MCGIAGLYSPGRRLSPDAVDTMIASMAHRGPDDQGKEILADGQLQFGHLRLRNSRSHRSPRSGGRISVQKPRKRIR